ncbi:MAG: hypothetical protein GX643_07390, partial [Acidimicrobiales bacterium]|nr:hypothetical protein [Acidimicrobiales bacterium]
MRSGRAGRAAGGRRSGDRSGVGTIDFDPKLLREACLLALRVAAEGELADPRIPAPSSIRPIMGFSRLSAAAYGRLRQAVDEDGEFRARVADAASEEVVGRAGLLWLTRPDGWLEDPAFAEAASVSTRARRGRTQGGVDAKLVRAREQAAKADEARRRVQAQRDG